VLQFYDTNFILTYYSIRNRFKSSLIQSMIEWIDKIDWNLLKDRWSGNNKLRWWDELMRKRTENESKNFSFEKRSFWSDNLIIWFDQLNFISIHHHSNLHAWTIRSRIASAYLRRFVSSISSSICWLRIESFYDYSIEMIYSNRDDFFHIYWFSKASKSQEARKWVCDSDEIRSKWQRSSKTSWSKEKSLMTIEDLDSQKDLNESWNEKSINKIIKEEFLHNEMNFSFKLNKQQLAIHSFVSQ
jgi:hypothetical protein